MNSPIEGFFKLGEKVTNNDPVRKADWDYYMFWIIFLAFFGIFIGNIWDFIRFHRIANLGWACFGAAVMWFQYFGLRQMYEFRKMVRKSVKDKDKPSKEKTVDEMLKDFKK